METVKATHLVRIISASVLALFIQIEAHVVLQFLIAMFALIAWGVTGYCDGLDDK